MAQGQLWNLTVGVCSTMKRSHPKSPLKLFHVYSTRDVSQLKAEPRVASFYGPPALTHSLSSQRKTDGRFFCLVL